LPNPSLEGGLELFELSRPNRRLSSETSARSTDISAFREAIKSSASAGGSIPPLIQIRVAMSPKSRGATQIPLSLWPFGLTMAWELLEKVYQLFRNTL
jgi:hypothetical protein